MKQFYGFLILCVLYVCTFVEANAQTPVEGSIWINPHLRSSEVGSEKVPLLIEKIEENKYQLSNTIGNVTLYSMLAFNKNCVSEQPCETSFNENCEAICNSDCSYVNALTGNPERMPLVNYHSSDFPNSLCFRKINTTHWYSLKTLEFAQNALNFNDIGISNTQTVYARYSPEGHWGNSNADDFGVTMNSSAANWADAICHEWGHYLNNKMTKGVIVTNNGGAEIQALDEGLGDIWSSLVRLYLEEGENIENFKTAMPDYRLWAVNRNFANTYKPYNTCAVLSDDLPSHVQTQAWTIGDEHIKGLSISHWFYLLSEGTNGNTYTVRLKVPENETAILTSSLCNNANFATKEKNLQFRVDGIGHWKSLQIVYKALSLVGEDEALQPLSFATFRCATEQAVAELFPSDCHFLQQVSNAWYALNVGESYDLMNVPSRMDFCEGESWALTLENQALDNIALYAPNGDLLANGDNAMNFEIESLSGASTGTYQLKYQLKDICNATLNGTCEWTKNIEVNVESLPQILTSIPEQAICQMESISLNAEDFLKADTYEWQNENGEIIGEGKDLVFEPAMNTELQLVGKNDCGTESLMTHIEVYELPEMTEILMETNGCQSENITLWVDALYDSYEWNGGNEGENSLVVYEAGTYELTVANEQGCSTQMSIEVKAEDFPVLAVDFEAGYVLPSDEVWTEKNHRIAGKLIVPSGRTLEIENIEVEFLNEASGIVVEEGAILKVSNAVLKGNKCENRAWAGILAKGDAYKTQTQLQYQSQVFLTNSTIQDAYIGVEMGEGYSDAFLATGGGIVVAENTQFVNNSVGILFHAYLNESQSRISSNCSFVFNESFKGAHHLGDFGYIGILAINIGGVEVKNSSFKNEQNSDLLNGQSERGVGIVSWHAPMRIGTGDVLEQNHFSRLYKGIEAYSTSTILGYMLIEGNLFEEVNKGIHLQNNHFSSIVGNRFEGIAGENAYGVYVQKGEGATIANNVFEAGSIGSEQASTWGMIVGNSGHYGCTVYNNEFTKRGSKDKFFAAVQFEGENNPNVLVDCNRFEAISNYDLLLLDDSKRYFSEEGGCDEFDPLISPLKNQWHTLCDNVDTYHLYHDNEEVEINWTFVPGFEPNCYSNNIQPIVCEDDVNDCSLGGFGQLSDKDESDILDNVETAITPNEHSLAISQLVRYHLKTKDLPTAIRTLQQDKQMLSLNTKTKVLSTPKTQKNELTAFNRSLVKTEKMPQKPKTGENNFTFIRQRRATIYTNSSAAKQIRTTSAHLELENSHVKVKFDRSLNHFEGIDVVAIISDMNGRVLHHQQIGGNDGEYVLDRELLSGEKYICSLWVNGGLLKSRKFAVVN